MTPDQLKSLCTRVNSGMSPRWHRGIAIAIWRNKRGLPDAYRHFTLREKFYTWTGI